MRAVVVADAISYVLASGLLWAAVRGMRTGPSPAGAIRRKGYRAVLTDRGNIALAAMNVIATLLVTAPLLAMPILVIDQLHFAVWLPALLGALTRDDRRSDFLRRSITRSSVQSDGARGCLRHVGCWLPHICDCFAEHLGYRPAAVGNRGPGTRRGCLRTIGKLSTTGIGSSRPVGPIHGRAPTRVGNLSRDRACLGSGTPCGGAALPVGRSRRSVARACVGVRRRARALFERLRMA